MESSSIRTGIVLYTFNYPQCVAFYRDVLGLAVHFRTREVTCFAFGASYLMVEPGADRDTPPNHRTCLRLNVANIRACADRLIDKGVAVDWQEHDWGTVAKFRDPDGNLCALRDAEGFERQMPDAGGC